MTIGQHKLWNSLILRFELIRTLPYIFLGLTRRDSHLQKSFFNRIRLDFSSPKCFTARLRLDPGLSIGPCDSLEMPRPIYHIFVRVTVEGFSWWLLLPVLLDQRGVVRIQVTNLRGGGLNTGVQESVNDAHNVSTTGATTSFQLSPPIQGATPTSKEGSTGADVKVSRDDAKSLSYGDRSPPKVKAWPGMPSGSPSPSSSPGRKGVIRTPPRSPSLSILPDIRDEVNPALIQAKMVLERLQEAHMQRKEERERAMLTRKKKKRKKPSQAPPPKSGAGSDAAELLWTDTSTLVERERVEPPSSERWLVMFLSISLLIVSVFLFVVLFGIFSREELELRADKQEVRLLPGFDKIIQDFQRYYSYVQWIVAAREHDQVVKHLSGHLCQVISVTQVEVSAPWDDYRSCEERRVIPAADVSMLAAYAALNITLVETCNNGETDSLLLDRRVDFVTTIPKLVFMRSYYGTYLGRSPASIPHTMSTPVKICIIAWMFTMLILGQFTQTAITASRSVPALSSQMKSVEQFESRLDDKSVLPCMHFFAKNIVDEFSRSVSHLNALRGALEDCGPKCLTHNVRDFSFPLAQSGTHAIVHMCRLFKEGKGCSSGLVVGEEELAMYLKWLPTHTRFPLRRQQRRLMLAIEESGLWLHHITRRFPPCSNGVAMAVFDMPFSDYATVYLVGCLLSLLAFSAEAAYQRCFLARRLQASVPAVVIRHR
ncbi:hypothetical protein HPB51_008037 [Rhipicephalus microplus]|uniref:Uncharacterized protein n=1 Tax=Rhipicephalus microplus TaxID=6941 RepID=A0A9J6ES71_RHIMP|nr:hypothetical protein HPB51_008037 [Rhipicephalus microplus]